MPRLKFYVFGRNLLPVCNTFCMVSLFSPTSLPSPPLFPMFIHKAELWNMHLMGPLLAHRMALAMCRVPGLVSRVQTGFEYLIIFLDLGSCAVNNMPNCTGSAVHSCL